SYSGAVLWVRNEDWWTIRDRLFADRQREFETEAIFDRHWSVHQAAAWLASRDSTTVNALPGRWNALQGSDPEFDGWLATWIALSDGVSVRFCGCGQRSLSCPALEAARGAVRAACERGSGRAYGQRSASAPREQSPPLEFHEAELWHGRGLTLGREVGGKGVSIWHELRFDVGDVVAMAREQRQPPQAKSLGADRKYRINPKDVPAFERMRQLIAEGSLVATAAKEVEREMYATSPISHWDRLRKAYPKWLETLDEE